MDNHYYLVVETIEDNLSKGAHQLIGAHSRHHHQTGHLFKRRYKAMLANKEAYLLELARNVVLNPIRDKMLENINDRPWSSYLAMTGATKPPNWFETD